MTFGCSPRFAALTDIFANLPVSPPSSKVKTRVVDVDNAVIVVDFYPSVLALVLLKNASIVDEPEGVPPSRTRRSE